MNNRQSSTTNLKHSLQAACIAALLLSSAVAQAADGLIASKSSFSVSETMDRFEAVAKGKAMKIFARVNHAAGAKTVGQDLRPTELLIFGNPKGGTPLMQCSQSFAIDLPLKALAWQDDQGQVWLGVNDIEALASRHEASDCPAVAKVKGALSKFMAAALK
ncbi:MAG: DUF302 domain-containing protein [Burkholderiaceae bacterium]